jgi:hypothetical protein
MGRIKVDDMTLWRLAKIPQNPSDDFRNGFQGLSPPRETRQIYKSAPFRTLTSMDAATAARESAQNPDPL